MTIDTDLFLLLADMENSTRQNAETAQRVGDILQEQLSHLSKIYKRDLYRPLELNYGDEIAGLFISPAPIYQIVSQLRHALRSYSSFRFVVARGRIGREAPSTSQMGGPVFEAANTALQQLKKDGEFSQWLVANEQMNAVLTAMSQASHAFITEMTDYQYDVYRLYETGMKQKDIAAQLGKFEQSISDAIKRGRAELVIKLDQSIQAMLADI